MKILPNVKSKFKVGTKYKWVSGFLSETIYTIIEIIERNNDDYAKTTPGTLDAIKSLELGYKNKEVIIV